MSVAGTWDTQGPEPEIGIPGLQKGSGVVVFQLKTSRSHKDGVHDVEVPIVSLSNKHTLTTACGVDWLPSLHMAMLR